MLHNENRYSCVLFITERQNCNNSITKNKIAKAYVKDILTLKVKGLVSQTIYFGSKQQTTCFPLFIVTSPQV